MTDTIHSPEDRFGRLASDEQIQRTVRSLEANNIRAFVTENAAQARQKTLELIPVTAEVFTSTSVTLSTLGIAEEIDQSGRYNSVRAKLAMMDPSTENRKMQKMGATPDYIVGSVHAISETGSIIIASATGSQLSGYVAGAANVVWVVGAQKIVATVEEGLERVREYTFPLEDRRALQAYGVHSGINKLLIVHKESMPGRISVVFVKENVGF